MKGMPIHDTSLKWLKVTPPTQKLSHTFQEASYSKKSTQNKTLTSLKGTCIFPVNPLTRIFCGYTILNTFVSLKKTVFMNFPDSACELSLLNKLSYEHYFHMAFEHLPSRNRTKPYFKPFSEEVTVGSHIISQHL